MVEAFLSGGVMMWPLLAIAIGVLVLAARTAYRVASADSPAPEVTRSLQAILFWGGASVVIGVLGMVVGIVVMAQAIGLAGSVEAPLVWGGFGVSLVTLIFGLLIFLLAAVSWFVLRQWYLRKWEHVQPRGSAA